MELEARFREAKETLLCEDPFNRPDPLKQAVCSDSNDGALAALLTPLWFINYFFPLQYFTSWYRILIIIEVLLDLTHDDLHIDPVFSGSIWIIGVSVPISSTVIFVYATELRRRVTQRLDPRVYIY